MPKIKLFQETEDEAPREYTAEEVQYLLVEHLYTMVDYWVKLDECSLKYRLEGLTHSMWVTFNGCAGGFDASCYMKMYSTPEQITKAKSSNNNFFPEGEENAYEIDTHLLQATTSTIPDRVDAGLTPRAWTEEEANDIFRHEVALRLNFALASEGTEFDKGYYFLHSLLDMIENGLISGLANIRLFSYGIEEDRDYFIEEEQNYFPLEAPISGIEKSLLETYADIKTKTRSAR